MGWVRVRCVVLVVSFRLRDEVYIQSMALVCAESTSLIGLCADGGLRRVDSGGVEVRSSREAALHRGINISDRSSYILSMRTRKQ